MVESAVMYTVGMGVLLVLLVLGHPARLLVHSCMVPVTGEFPLSLSELVPLSLHLNCCIIFSLALVSLLYPSHLSLNSRQRRD
jgi:hypothetical protein